MKGYLNNKIDQLHSYSLSLSKSSVFMNKPWVFIDENNEVQKLIFKRNNELILSKNGNVQEGRWEYFPEAKSILIDRKVDKILCNEVYIDNGILVLKKDGSNNDLFILMNENLVPELDAHKYFVLLWRKKNNVSSLELEDGRVMGVMKKNEFDAPQPGDYIYFDFEPAEDGEYLLKGNDIRCVVKNGEILKNFYPKRYKTDENKTFIIQQEKSWNYSIGDSVYQNKLLVVDSEVKISRTKTLILKEGKITEIKRKNIFTFNWLFNSK